MKWLAFASLALACSESVAPPPKPPVDWASFKRPEPVDAGRARATEKERMVATEYAQAFASDGFRALTPLLGEDAHVTFAQKTALGRDKVVQMHQQVFGAFDHRVLTLRRVLFTDSEQAIAWTLTATQALDWEGIPATHKPIATRGISLVWTKDDGSIGDIHVYFDENVVKAQLGVGPPELQSLPPAPVPSGAPRVVEQAGTAEEAANVLTLRSTIDALEDNKPAIYLGAFADDVSIDGLERAQPAHGKDAAKAYFETMRKSIGQLDTLAQGGFGAGDWAVLEYSISGVQQAQVDRVPFVHGRAIRLHVVDIAEIHDGKITDVVRYDDPAEVNQ
ncbi:MAG TPA: nuclear transport factor 2 family protein [Polyangiaceae bacterium]|jgi:steroid delta-isomerase-like uncharacterized protein